MKILIGNVIALFILISLSMIIDRDGFFAIITFFIYLITVLLFSVFRFFSKKKINIKGLGFTLLFFILFILGYLILLSLTSDISFGEAISELFEALLEIFGINN